MFIGQPLMRPVQAAEMDLAFKRFVLPQLSLGTLEHAEELANDVFIEAWSEIAARNDSHSQEVDEHTHQLREASEEQLRPE